MRSRDRILDGDSDLSRADGIDIEIGFCFGCIMPAAELPEPA